MDILTFNYEHGYDDEDDYGDEEDDDVEERESEEPSPPSSFPVDHRDHPCWRKRADAGAVFSSSCCPPGPGSDARCGLPFGCAITPLSPLPPPDEEHPTPTLCVWCLAHFSPYASFDAATGRWTCPLCGGDNAAPPEVFQGPASRETVMEYRHATTSPGENDAETENGDREHQRRRPPPSTTVLVLDENLSPRDMRAVVDALDESLPSNHHLGLIVFGAAVSVYRLGGGAGGGVVAADAFPADRDDSTDDDSNVQREREPFPLRRGRHLASADETGRAATFGALEAVLASRALADRDDDDTDGNNDGDENERGLGRREILRRRRERRTAGAGDVRAARPFVRRRRRPAKRCAGTAARAAVELAASGVAADGGGRVLLFTDGCPNVGVGGVVVDRSSSTTAIVDAVDPAALSRALPVYRALGERARQRGIAVDVFCAGTTALGLPALQSLASASSGYALPHDSFTEDDLRRNLRHLTTHTFMSKRGHDCLLDVRLPSYIHPAQVIGPGEVVDDDGNQMAKVLRCERPIFASCASLAASQEIPTHNLPSPEAMERSTLLRVRLGRVDPLSTFTVLLDVREPIEDERFVLVQFVVRYVEPDTDVVVTRVFTHRLPVARTARGFLDGVDEEVVPVLLGREAVTRANARGKEIAADLDKTRVSRLARRARADLDETVRSISHAFRASAVDGDGDDADAVLLDYAFPPELVDPLHMLHHLRRGALLSPSLSSAEDLVHARDVLLRLPLEDALLMLVPSLRSVKVDFAVPTPPGPEALEHVPPETLALWDDVVLAGDHHDRLFVWSGRALVDARFDPVRAACRRVLEEGSARRFPAPRAAHETSEGDPGSRRLTCRLSPTHADPPDHQVAHFPALGTELTEDELRRLRDKFRYRGSHGGGGVGGGGGGVRDGEESSSDVSFRRWFWSVVGSGSTVSHEKNDAEAVSLSDVAL